MNTNTPPSLLPIPASVAAFLAENHQLFIDGKWVDAQSGETMDIINPATGKVIAKAALGGAADIDMAVKAARRAFDTGPWSKMPASARAKLILALADALEAEVDDYVMIDTLNMGMPYFASKWVTGMLSLDGLRYNAGWAGKIGGETLEVSAPDHHAYTLREPIGVVGAIVPWNSPLMAAVGKLAPILAAGCTVVLKPAELTPLSVIKLSKLIKKVGFPDGVINIVNGHGHIAGQALVDHPLVDKITFTGSTAVGKTIVRSVAATMKRVSLELGGKSPVFIFADANMDAAIEAAASGIFRNAGQICAAGSRLYVQKSVYDKVVSGVVDRAKALRVGSPLQPGIEMGPVVSAKQMERVMSYIESGRSEGAELVTGGGKVGSEGYFVQPTVMTHTNGNLKVVREEIFGPVLPIVPFDTDDLDQIAALGNASEYGLSAYVWTSNISTAHKMVKKLQVGSARINGGVPLDKNVPFGGYKQSGWGQEYGRQGVEAYLASKAITVQL